MNTAAGSEPASSPSSPGPRLRPHPEQRFYESPLQVFDFAQAVHELREESNHELTATSAGHRQRALYSRGPVTVAVFDLQPGSMIREHVVINGSAFVQAVQGHVIVRSDVGEHTVQQGQILCIAPGVRHDVSAPDGAQMLLTVCLEYQPMKSQRPKVGAGAGASAGHKGARRATRTTSSTRAKPGEKNKRSPATGRNKSRRAR